MKNVDDPKLKKAYEDMIINFGQTPIQLFKQPHPKRNVSKTNFSYGIVMNEKWNVSSTKQMNYPIQSIKIKEDNFNGYTHGYYNEKSNKIIQWNDNGTISVSQNGKVINLMENIHQMGKMIMAFVDNIIVCGGIDGLIYVFDISNGLKQIGILRGHEQSLKSICISHEYSLIISGDTNGVVIVWDLYSMKIIRSFRHGEAINIIRIQEETGEIVTLSNTLLKHWTINGELIQQCTLSEIPTDAFIINVPEWIPNHLLFTGHIDGSLRVWKLDESLCDGVGDCTSHSHQPKLINACSHHSAEVTCIYIPDDLESIYIGYKDGLLQKLN